MPLDWPIDTRRFRHVPYTVYLLIVTVLASVFTFGVMWLALQYNHYVIHRGNSVLDGSNNLSAVELWDAFRVVCLAAAPCWFVTVLFALLSGRYLLPVERQAEVNTWRLWLAFWSALAALVLALFPWPSGGRLEFFSQASLLVSAPLFAAHPINHLGTYLANPVLFALIGAVSGGLVIPPRRRLRAT